MENVLTDNYKSLRSIVWTVQEPLWNRTVVSRTFLFQDRNRSLNFFTGSDEDFVEVYPYLKFKWDGELQLPVPVILRVITNCETLVRLEISITCANQTIWSYTKDYLLINHRLIFELIFHVECSNDDRCIQTASYLNTSTSIGSLSEDFSKLLETGSDHDVQVRCGEDAIKTHKLVLGTRSNVFRAMLQSDMLEGHSGVIEIQDMDISYFKEFIRYLYTDVMPELTFDKAKALYKAGDKYDVRNLVLRCAEYLQDTLSPENAFECYALADAHSDANLKNIIKTYLLDQKIYLQNEHWSPFYKSFPDVALEVYRLSYEKNQQ